MHPRKFGEDAEEGGGDDVDAGAEEEHQKINDGGEGSLQVENVGQRGQKRGTDVDAGQKSQKQNPFDFLERKKRTEFFVNRAERVENHQNSGPGAAQSNQFVNCQVGDLFTEKTDQESKSQVAQKPAQGKFENDPEARFRRSALGQEVGDKNWQAGAEAVDANRESC